MTSYPAAEQLLGRVLGREVDVSALLAYCATLDPIPLQRHIGLPEPIVGARVEVPYGARSRLDVVLDGPTGAQAVLELKVSATEHGDQLARYDEFAQERGAQRFIADLELPGTRVPVGWTRLNLADVFGCWEQSAEPTARTFATRVAEVFRTWTKQAQGPFSTMDPAIITVVARAVAATLTADGIETDAVKTSAGQPCLVAFKPHPSGHPDAFLSVEVRCQDKTESSRPWLLRMGVHVDAGDDITAARSTAHRLATQLEPALELDAVRSQFTPDLPELAAAIDGDHPLKSPRERYTEIARWLVAASDPETRRLPRHPVFHHDWGRRLAAQFTLDVPSLTADDVADIIRLSMAHLTTAASVEDNRT